MNERGRNESDISRYTDVEYSPEGYKTVYRWGDFLEIAGGHVYNAMDTIDLVSTGGEYEGFNPRYAYTCEFVGCSTLVDGIALFRPVSRDGEDLTQIAFLRSDIDDDTGAYTECFEAGSFDIAAAADFFAAAARVAGDAFSRTTATFLRACSALSRASAYLASARCLAPYRSMYFAAFAV